MIKKIFKITVICCVLVFAFGNIMSVSAKENTEVDKELDEKSLMFENLIYFVINTKNENPKMSENEIIKIISDDLTKQKIDNRGILDIWNALTDSEKKLVVRYPFDALKVNNAKNIATDQTEKKFGYNGLGDRSDAFRHGIWNAEMTILIGAEKAELFATAHEDKDTSGVESDGHTKLEHKNMDLHNNSVGRRIGQENPKLSEDEMADYIYQMIYQVDSEFIWLND